MELQVTTFDYCVQKVQIAASFVDADINVVSGLTQAQLVAAHPQARSMVLRHNGEYLAQHNAILRFIANLKPEVSLYGPQGFDTSQIDQWLDFSWLELEVPMQAFMSASSDSSSSVKTEQMQAVQKKARVDIAAALDVSEKHLIHKTYMVGEAVTIADISLCCAIAALSKLGLLDAIAFPSVLRWLMTISTHPRVAPILGDISSSSSAGSGDFAGGKWARKRIRVKELLLEGAAAIGREVTLKGWIRTCRSAEKGKLHFVELNDGSSVRSVQIVLDVDACSGADAAANAGGVGASLSVRGLVVSSPAKGQVIEVHARTVEVIGQVYGGDHGEVGGKNYPMAKKQHSLEFLREKAHLRIRSKVFSSAMRMRSAMAFATHKFFHDRGFVYTHTPLITASDCEGAGEMFVVTTLLGEHATARDIPVTAKGEIDYSKDFFGRRSCLTVSGQLNVETHACALSDVYTFGPTFRAENSHTSRHLAEFWMIEPEICFADLADDMTLAEDYIKFCAAFALENCADDLQYFEEEYPAGEKGLRARLQNVVAHEFAQITYTEAVALLQRHIAENRVGFERYPNWGDDLGSEHERYITEKVYQRPTIVTDYPKGIKAFYMRLNDDNETVAAMDILVPKIGEIIGGSQREERLDVLERRVVEMGLTPQDIWWYADLRRYGSVPHAGFGLGFERLVMFVTGLENIRDVIPFPRTPGHVEF